MLRRVLLLQLLTIWATAVQAFFPWYPEFLCSEDNICTHQDSRRHEAKSNAAPAERAPPTVEGVSFKLSQRVPDVSESLETRVSRAVERLVEKYSGRGGSRTLRRRPDVTKRANKFSVVSAAPPTATNAVGVAQDGTDFSYFIQAAFGSSSKLLYLLLDTGAGTTWVMGSSCQSAACAIHDSYGPADSKTLQPSTQTFSIAYGSGTVSGNLVSDSISIAGTKSTLSFGVANTTSNDFSHFPFDGILGLSMSKGATDNFMDTVKSQKVLASNLFSVSLSRNADGPNTGEVTFGATDPAKFTGSISYTPVSSKGGGDWAVPMDDILYDGKKAGVTGKLAYIDTGTTYVFGPAGDVAALHKQIPGATSTDGVTYTVPCTSNKPLGIVFSGVTYSVSPKDWLSAPSSDGLCTSNIYGHEVVADSWLLGDLYLKNVYSVFDMDQTRIGFANKPAVASPPPSASTTTSAAPPGGATATSSTLTTVITPKPDSSSSDSSFPGLSGHETSATAVAETASTPTPTHTSPGEQLEGSKYVSMICIVAAIVIAA